MSVTESLLRVFRADQQLRGLTGRLQSAEKFLGEQVKQLEQLNAKRTSLQQQLRLAQAKAAEHEADMKASDERIEKLKGQMDSSQTNKEYKALLTELNTYKADRSSVETEALTQMQKVDELRKQMAELDKQAEEREKLRKVAESDRQKKEAEIADRLAELKAERSAAASQVSERVMKVYAENVRSMGEEAMAPVQELDRRNHEYTCGSCQMTVPVDKMATLMRPNSDEIVRCASCRAILYVEKDTAEQFNTKTSRSGTGGRKKKAKTESQADAEV